MVTDVSAFIFEKIKGIPQAVKYAILSALIIGFVTHIVFYTSNIVNHDSVLNIADTCGWLLSQGKWFAEATNSGIRGIFPANGITTPLAIIYLALASGFTVSALSIKKPIYAILISGFLVTFPSVASSLLYHGGDYFCVTLLLAAMAAYFTIKFKWGFLIGIVTLTLSLGSYMAYIGYSAALMLSVCLIDSISNKKSAKDILLQALKYIAVLVVACLFYYGILQLRLQQLNVGLSDYRGIDQMGQFSLSTLPGIICQSVLKVINFFKSDLFGTGAAIFVWMYRLVALLGVILVSVSVWKSRAYRKITKVLLTVLFVLLFPIAIHLIAILGMNTETSWIMIFPFVAAFILVIKLMENFQALCEEQKESKHY
ncbi:MAG: glucosyltransferase domain-containing protein, partial [Christensenellaceae bacterium]